jgi:aminopeptidase-like protein
MINQQLYEDLFDKIFPLNRSITGPGFLNSLNILSKHMPLEVKSIKSGTTVYDWTVPYEWDVTDAYIITPNGNKICDFKKLNLHIVNFSCSVDKKIKYDELLRHLHYKKDLPDAVPYVTSYYKKDWGFCISYNDYLALPKQGDYHVFIDSKHTPGYLNYGELIIKSKYPSKREILISTYLCHPSMGNNELSGPLAILYIYNKIKREALRYNFRLIIIPETIGSLVFLQMNQNNLSNIHSGLVLTCLGGNQEKIRFKKTFESSSIIDIYFDYISRTEPNSYYTTSFYATDGSDERQYNSPGFRLPIGQAARTIYGQYEEYHTSFDNKEFMNLEVVMDSSEKISKLLINYDFLLVVFVRTNPYGEPFLSKYDLYPTKNSPYTRKYSNDNTMDSRKLLNNCLILLNEVDGKRTMVEILNKVLIPLTEAKHTLELLIDRKLINEVYDE